MNERIVFMGTPDFAANILEGLIKAEYNIVAVVTQPDAEIGRKRVLTPSSVKSVALKYNIPVLTPNKIRLEYEPVLAYKPDLIITSAYGQIIPSEILDYPKYKCINTHGSLLPKYRGASPIQSAIMNGETTTGMSIMYMNEKMDEGDILVQKTIDIDIHDTSTTLFNKMSQLTLDILLDFLPKLFNNDINPIKQDDSKATYTHLLKKDIEHIDFNDNVLNVYNHIRGLLDNPGCHFMIKGKQYKIIDAFYEEADNCKPNTFIGLFDNYLRIDCKDGFIKIYDLKPEGKNTMNAKAFFNGNGRNLVGETIE
jgi:methionyl-tRNA formyltransferase